MQENVTTLNINTLTDKDVAKGVRFENPQSQFAPDGMVNPITGKKRIDSKTTINLNTQNYRMGKFMREFSKIGFDDLQEVVQPNGDTAWVMDRTIDNQDFNFYISQVDILSTITLTEVNSEEEIQQKAKEYKIKPKQTYITIDGIKYFIHMDVPMNFGTGQNNDTWINLGIFVLGDSLMKTAIAGVIAEIGLDAFDDVLKNLSSAVFETLWAVIIGPMRAVYRFIARLIGSLTEGEEFGAAVAAGRVAAGDAWTETFENITYRTLKHTVFAVIIIVTLMLIIDYVLHESYQNVYFYNLTSYDIQLDFPYKDEGEYHNLPTQNVLAKVDRKGPGGIDLGEWYNGVAFRYQSDSEFHGLGYTMRFKLFDPKTQKLVKTFSCLFDVPFSGDNSLYASTSEPSSYSNYYSSNSGDHKVTQYSANDSHQEIIVTYDYLSGKHTDPGTGNKLYLYSSLVIIRDVV
ncbi:hypothetical protein [Dapis sp. BLCC M229]|uniref:hypothetical protein n=1 Tax=Dapis sp. BLCC M229 TaxID=3400188 RepID=UPI003CE95BE8